MVVSIFFFYVNTLAQRSEESGVNISGSSQELLGQPFSSQVYEGMYRRHFAEGMCYHPDELVSWTGNVQWWNGSRIAVAVIIAPFFFV